MPFFDCNLGMQVLPGIHFDPLHGGPQVVELPCDHLAFQPMPAGQQWVKDAQGVPRGYEPQPAPLLTREQVDAQRKEAYQQRSDPLYMQWQYDQTPEAGQLWRDEVAAIKAEYPFPVEVTP